MKGGFPVTGMHPVHSGTSDKSRVKKLARIYSLNKGAFCTIKAYLYFQCVKNVNEKRYHFVTGNVHFDNCQS